MVLAGLVALRAVAVPLDSNTTTLASSGTTVSPYTVSSSTQGLVSLTIVAGSNVGASALTSVGSQAAMAPLPPAPATSTVTVTSTVHLPTFTVTITDSPQTVTETITIGPPPTLPPTLASTSATESSVHPTTWSTPPAMTDLSAFNIKNFASGQRNVRIIANDPPADTTDMALPSLLQGVDTIAQTLSKTVATLVSAIVSGIIPPPPKQASSSFLQLYYPADSIDPAQEPVGGADFYAAPLDLKGAKNVSLEYSVFFPSDFDWVEAGKLPGIYGGHEGCSGGDDATSCFSTRLMWRGDGLGELYLVSPYHS